MPYTQVDCDATAPRHPNGLLVGVYPGDSRFTACSPCTPSRRHPQSPAV